MLKLSRAMVGMLKLYVRCSAMWLDLCPKVLSPRSTKILSGFWQAMLDPFGGAKCKDRGNILGQIGARFCHFWPCCGFWMLQPCFLRQSWGILRVMLKLSSAMLCHVEDICQFCPAMLLVLHPEMLSAPPPAGPRFSVGLTLLAPSWDQLRPSRGPWWCHVGSIRCPSWPSRPNGINSKDHPKNKISTKTLIPMAGKRKRNQKSLKNISPKSQSQW